MDELLAQARTAFEHNQYTLALALYADILAQIDPATADPALRQVRLAALYDHGQLLQLLGKPQESLAVFERYYLEAGSSEQAVMALYQIGAQHRILGQYQKALEAYQEALQLAQALNYTEGRARLSLGLGSTFHQIGRVEDSLSSYQKAHALFSQLGEVPGQISSLIGVGVASYYLGRVDRAISASEEALRLARQHDQQSEVVILLSNLGEYHQSIYDLERAQAYHQEGLLLAERLGLGSIRADLYRNQGVNLLRLGEAQTGIDYLYLSLALAEEMRNVEIELQILFSLAVAEIEHGDPEKGRRHAERLQQQAEAGRLLPSQADALYALGLYHRGSGDLATAGQLWQRASLLAHETERRWLLWQTHKALADIAPTAALARAHRQLAADIVHQIAYPIEDKALLQIFFNAPPVRAVLES
ncbi:MAG: tetratricopeptide repeat protein [Chloroflexi bacterium]|nr:tetratricopeptide repeat protein [Chloroflexota bacterium]